MNFSSSENVYIQMRAESFDSWSLPGNPQNQTAACSEVVNKIKGKNVALKPLKVQLVIKVCLARKTARFTPGQLFVHSAAEVGALVVFS